MNDNYKQALLLNLALIPDEEFEGKYTQMMRVAGPVSVEQRTKIERTSAAMLGGERILKSLTPVLRAFETFIGESVKTAEELLALADDDTQQPILDKLLEIRNAHVRFANEAWQAQQAAVIRTVTSILCVGDQTLTDEHLDPKMFEHYRGAICEMYDDNETHPFMVWYEHHLKGQTIHTFGLIPRGKPTTVRVPNRSAQVTAADVQAYVEWARAEYREIGKFFRDLREEFKFPCEASAARIEQFIDAQREVPTNG